MSLCSATTSTGERCTRASTSASKPHKTRRSGSPARKRVAHVSATLFLRYTWEHDKGDEDEEATCGGTAFAEPTRAQVDAFLRGRPPPCPPRRDTADMSREEIMEELMRVCSSSDSEPPRFVEYATDVWGFFGRAVHNVRMGDGGKLTFDVTMKKGDTVAKLQHEFEARSDALSDTLWEGLPGDTAVYPTPTGKCELGVIDFRDLRVTA